MPVEIKGLKETRSALIKFAPDLKKEIDKDARGRLKIMVAQARGFVPAGLPQNLHGWADNKTYKGFPAFDSALIKTGIVYKTGFSRSNARGFRSLYSIRNESAAGAIYETAGRINLDGLPWVGPTASKSDHKVSHSVNKNAGAWFIDEIDKQDNQRQVKGKKEGRLIFRAVEADNGKFTISVLAGLARVEGLLKSRMEAKGYKVR